MSQTIIFFGATGGVTNACLTATLQSKQYKAIAMVRTPSKLRTQLITQQGLDPILLDDRLTIVQGNALDQTDVKTALLANITAGIDTTLPSLIVTGLGGAPSFTFNIWRPLQLFKVDQPTICEDAAKTVLDALRSITTESPSLASSKPAVVFVSTTGISRGPEDVPFWMRFLYHQLLAGPHEDKRKLEDTYRDHMGEEKCVLSGVTGIRPTLLVGSGALSEGVGIEKVRAGTEMKPETGYTVQRTDVGVWIFENVIQGNEGGKWRGEMVSLTS